MRRGDDFRAFVEKTHSLGLSLAYQYEAPEDCDIDYLVRVEHEKPVAENPYETSEIRGHGLKVWDSVYIPLPKKVSLDPVKPKDLAALRGTNAEWQRTRAALGMVGKPDGVHYIRPKGPHILDLLNDDIRLLQGAHILAHRSGEELSRDDYTFGELSGTFFKCLVKLFAAREYGLVVNVHPTVPVQDSFDLYGIEIFGSTELRSPILVSPLDVPHCRLVTDRTVVCLLGSVGVEAHPRQASEGTDWRAINKWACQPTLVSLAGWECVDYVSHGQISDYRGGPCHAVPAEDLQEMASFPELLETAVCARGRPGTGPHLYTVSDWLESEDFKSGLAETPQLPCPHCIRLNREAKGLVKRPLSGKPRRPLKDIRLSSVREHQEWVAYVEFMRNCISIGRKATAYATGSFLAMDIRNRTFKRKAAVLKRISSLELKYARKLANGYVSEAEAVALEIDRLKAEAGISPTREDNENGKHEEEEAGGKEAVRKGREEDIKGDEHAERPDEHPDRGLRGARRGGAEVEDGGRPAQG